MKRTAVRVTWAKDELPTETMWRTLGMEYLHKYAGVEETRCHEQ